MLFVASAVCSPLCTRCIRARDVFARRRDLCPVSRCRGESAPCAQDPTPQRICTPRLQCLNLARTLFIVCVGAMEGAAAPRVVVLTASADEDTPTDMPRVGMREVLTEPVQRFELEVLLGRMTCRASSRHIPPNCSEGIEVAPRRTLDLPGLPRRR